MRFCPEFRPRRFAGRGFSLTELLVVVGIIIALVALLIPALGHIKRKGYETSTNSTLKALSTAIDTYYETFSAYPGPLSFGTATADNNKISGAQNMLLGLSYAIAPSANSSCVPMPDNGTVRNASGAAVAATVDPTAPIGPYNYAKPGSNGLYEAMSPFYPVSAKVVGAPLKQTPGLTTYFAGGVKYWNGADNAPPTQNQFGFPVVLDNYPDALPILYYRRTPGISRTENSKSTAGLPRIALNKPTDGAAAFYVNENAEYTNSTALTSASGRPYNQTVTEDGKRAQNLTSGLLRSYFQDDGLTSRETDGSVDYRVRGGYLLLSAGTDRLYGAPHNSGQEGTVAEETKNDNLSLIGGRD